MAVDTKTIVNENMRGKKGFPRYAELMGIEPPTKTVPIENNIPQHDHKGLSLKEQVNIERDRRINDGFIFNRIKFQSRQKDRENIAEASTNALAAIMSGAKPKDYHWHGGKEKFSWIAEDNSTYPMDAQTFLEFSKAALEHKQSLIFAARKLKDMKNIPEDFREDRWWK